MHVVLGTRLTPPPSEEEGLYIQIIGAERVLWRNARYVWLAPLQAALVLSLLGGASSSAELIDALWGTCPHGGPTWDLACLRQVIWRTRTALEPLGLEIVFRNGLGYSLGDKDV